MVLLPNTYNHRNNCPDSDRLYGERNGVEERPGFCVYVSRKSDAGYRRKNGKVFREICNGRERRRHGISERFEPGARRRQRRTVYFGDDAKSGADAGGGRYADDNAYRRGQHNALCRDGSFCAD